MKIHQESGKQFLYERANIRSETERFQWFSSRCSSVAIMQISLVIVKAFRVWCDSKVINALKDAMQVFVLLKEKKKKNPP